MGEGGGEKERDEERFFDEGGGEKERDEEMFLAEDTWRQGD